MTRLTAAALLTTLVVCAPTARATPGVDAFNREVQDVYQRLLPKVLAEADREARKQLLAFEHKEKKLEVRVPRVGKIDLQIGTAPGFTEVAADRLALRIPRDGCWEVEVEADVELRYRLFKKWRTKLLPVRVIVSKIRVEAALELDTSDPYLPTLKRVEEPKTKFRVKLRSKKLLPGLLLRVLSPPATLIGRRLVKKVTADLAGKVTANLAGIPAPIPGDGKPLMTGAGAPLPVGLGEIARNVDAKIQRDHTPWGLVMPMHMDVAAPASERWVDAYRDGGPGNVGTPECRDDGGDSATWTGVYLASQAFRYAVEGSSEAQANVERTVDALEFLFAAYDDRGLIPRCAAPEGSSLGQKIVAANAAGFVRKLRGGQPWVAHTGGEGSHATSTPWSCSG